MTAKDIPLKLPAGITFVNSFRLIANKKSKNLAVDLNGNYDNKKVISSVSATNWKKTRTLLGDALRNKGVNDKDITLILDILDNNSDIILENISAGDDDNSNNNDAEQEVGAKNGQPHSELNGSIISAIKNARESNPNLTYEQWRQKLTDRFQNLQDIVNRYHPDMWESLKFTTIVKTILNIEDISTPFIGIILGPPATSKTLGVSQYDKWLQTYPTDDFTPASLVTHSAAISPEELAKVDMLPQIRDKVLLTPELAPLFTAPDDEIRSQFGLINRVADGHGLRTNSGVHGQRGYRGRYMFVWVGIAVEIPDRVYKFLAMTGFKLYFLRLPVRKKSEAQRVEDLLNTPDFDRNIQEISKALLDYLVWFEVCPLNVVLDDAKSGKYDFCKVPWDKDRDKTHQEGREVATINVRLGDMLARLRGYVQTYKRRDEEEAIEEPEGGSTKVVFTTEFEHGFAIIEDPQRASRQLYNYTRACALATEGRNWITKQDIKMAVNIMMSTAPMSRTKVFRLLISSDGIVSTSHISDKLNVSSHTAKRTMTEFKGLGLVEMSRIDPSNEKSEYVIELKEEFNWFLQDEFKNLLGTEEEEGEGDPQER